MKLSGSIVLAHMITIWISPASALIHQDPTRLGGTKIKKERSRENGENARGRKEKKQNE